VSCICGTCPFHLASPPLSSESGDGPATCGLFHRVFSFLPGFFHPFASSFGGFLHAAAGFVGGLSRILAHGGSGFLGGMSGVLGCGLGRIGCFVGGFLRRLASVFGALLHVRCRVLSKGSGYSDVLGTSAPIATTEMSNVVIPAQANTTILIPLTIIYSEAVDPQQKALKELITNCGLLGGAQKPIPLEYAVNVVVQAIIFPISLPTFSGSTQFDCPIPAGFANAEIDQLIAQFKSSG